MDLSRYEPTHLTAVIHTFQSAIETLAANHYTAEQRSAWKSHLSPERFNEKLLMGETHLYLSANKVAAFAQLHPANHINYLYTHPDFARQGLASKLLEHLEALAHSKGITVLETEASYSARPVFEKHGYIVLEEENTVRAGISLPRFRMRKTLVKD